jgi:hypothetical protein
MIIASIMKKASVIILLILLMVSCIGKVSNEFMLDLAEVVETGYGNTVDGDSMYWAIYEEWDNDCQRHLLYMDKETYDSLESAVHRYNKADKDQKDSLNSTHGFILIRDSKGLHLSSIR